MVQVTNPQPANTPAVCDRLPLVAGCLGVPVGLVLVDLASGGAVSAGIGITKFALASMVLAGAVLLATGRRFRRAALLQAVPPALALLASALF